MSASAAVAPPPLDASATVVLQPFVGSAEWQSEASDAGSLSSAGESESDAGHASSRNSSLISASPSPRSRSQSPPTRTATRTPGGGRSGPSHRANMPSQHLHAHRPVSSGEANSRPGTSHSAASVSASTTPFTVAGTSIPASPAAADCRPPSSEGTLAVAGSTILLPRPPPAKPTSVRQPVPRRPRLVGGAAKAAERAAEKLAADAQAERERLEDAADEEEVRQSMARGKQDASFMTALAELATAGNRTASTHPPVLSKAILAERAALHTATAPAPYVPSRVAQTSVDMDDAATAPVDTILHTRFVLDPIEQRRAEKDRKMGFELAFADAAVGLSDVVWEPYHLQGDSSLYHSSVLVVRDSLQYHPRIAKWVSRFWHTFAHHTHAGFMAYREYEGMHLRISRALFAHWDRKEALNLCKLDWRRDTRALPGVSIAVSSVTGSGGGAGTGGTLLSLAHFSKSLFELVDLWTTTVDVEEYVDFLAVLYARITAITEADIAAPPEEMRKPPLKPRSAGEDAAAPVALHHTDPAHKHNVSAAERRRKALQIDTTAGRSVSAADSEPPSGLAVGDDGNSAATTAAAVGPPAPGFTPIDYSAAWSPDDSPTSSPTSSSLEWSGMGHLASYADSSSSSSHLEQVRQRHQAEQEDEQASTILALLRADDERARIHADGSIDSGTSKILPLIDHARAELAGPGYKVDADDTLLKRFPVPDFAAMRARAGKPPRSSDSGMGDTEADTDTDTEAQEQAQAQAQAQADAAAAAAAAEEAAMLEKAGMALAFRRTASLIMPLSDAEILARKAERLSNKEREDAERLARYREAQAAQIEADRAAAQEADDIARDLMPSSSESEEEAKRDEGEGEGEGDDKGKSPSRGKSAPKSATRESKDERRRRLLEADERRRAARKRLDERSHHAASTLHASVRPNRELVAARASKNKVVVPRRSAASADAEGSAWAANTLARQEESRRLMIEAAIAARRQVRVQKALQVAQRRLAEVQSQEARRAAERAAKEEREMDFFRQLDESIAHADPSYVPPPMPPGFAPHPRPRPLDLSDDALDAAAMQAQLDAEDARTRAAEAANPPGYRTRSSVVRPRARPHGPLTPMSTPTAASTPGRRRGGGNYLQNMNAFELEKARQERLRVEARKRDEQEVAARALQDGLVKFDYANASDAEGNPDADSDGEEESDAATHRRRLRRLRHDQRALGLESSLAPVDDEGAFDRYTPQLAHQLSEEITKLTLLDGRLGRTFDAAHKEGGGAGGGEGAYRTWDASASASPRKGGGGGANSSSSMQSRIIVSDPPRPLTLAEQSTARAALIGASKRLKFLRAKAVLARKTHLAAHLDPAVSHSEARELMELEARLEGRVNKAGDVLELSFLALAQGRDVGNFLGDKKEGKHIALTGFRLAPMHAAGSKHDGGPGGDPSQLLSGDSKFWVLRQRMARRRELKYSAMAVLSEDGEEEEGGGATGMGAGGGDNTEGGGAGGIGVVGVAASSSSSSTAAASKKRGVDAPLVMQSSLPLPSHIGASTAALGQRSSIVSLNNKSSPIRRLLHEHEAKLRARARQVINLGDGGDAEEDAEAAAESNDSGGDNGSYRQQAHAVKDGTHFSRRRKGAPKTASKLPTTTTTTTQQLLEALTEEANAGAGQGRTDDGETSEEEYESDISSSSFDSASSISSEADSVSAVSAATDDNLAARSDTDQDAASVVTGGSSDEESGGSGVEDTESLSVRKARLKALLRAADAEFSLTGHLSEPTRARRKHTLVLLRGIRAEERARREAAGLHDETARRPNETEEEYARRRRRMRRKQRSQWNTAKLQAQMTLDSDAQVPHSDTTGVLPVDSAGSLIASDASQPMQHTHGEDAAESQSPDDPPNVLHLGELDAAEAAAALAAQQDSSPESATVTTAAQVPPAAAALANPLSPRVAAERVRLERRRVRRAVHDAQKRQRELLKSHLRSTGERMGGGRESMRHSRSNSETELRAAHSRSPSKSIEYRTGSVDFAAVEAASRRASDASSYAFSAAAPLTELQKALRAEREAQAAVDAEMAAAEAAAQKLARRQARREARARRAFATKERQGPPGTSPPRNADDIHITPPSSTRTLPMIRTRVHTANSAEEAARQLRRRQQRMHALVPNPLSHIYSRKQSSATITHTSGANSTKGVTVAASEGEGQQGSTLSRPAALRLQMSRADLLPTSASLPLGAGTLNPVSISFMADASSGALVGAQLASPSAAASAAPLTHPGGSVAVSMAEPRAVAASRAIQRFFRRYAGFSSVERARDRRGRARRAEHERRENEEASHTSPERDTNSLRSPRMHGDHGERASESLLPSLPGAFPPSHARPPAAVSTPRHLPPPPKRLSRGVVELDTLLRAELNFVASNPALTQMEGGAPAPASSDPPSRQARRGSTAPQLGIGIDVETAEAKQQALSASMLRSSSSRDNLEKVVARLLPPPSASPPALTLLTASAPALLGPTPPVTGRHRGGGFAGDIVASPSAIVLARARQQQQQQPQMSSFSFADEEESKRDTHAPITRSSIPPSPATAVAAAMYRSASQLSTRIPSILPQQHASDDRIPPLFVGHSSPSSTMPQSSAHGSAAAKVLSRHQHQAGEHMGLESAKAASLHAAIAQAVRATTVATQRGGGVSGRLFHTQPLARSAREHRDTAPTLASQQAASSSRGSSTARPHQRKRVLATPLRPHSQAASATSGVPSLGVVAFGV